MPGGTHAEVGPWIPAAIAREMDRWSERVGEQITADDVEPLNWMLAEIGHSMSATDYIAATEQAFAWAREICAPFGQAFDLLLTPTATTPPPPLGWSSPDQPIPTLMERLGHSTVFTMPFDVTGQPAISLPASMNGDGLPIGVQLAAESGREDLLFRVAAQLEQAQPWAGRRPPAID
jgi:amidase